MQITFSKTSARFLAGVALLSGATLIVAVGCGGGSSGGGSPSGGSGGSDASGGDTATGGDTSTGATSGDTSTGGDTTTGGTGNVGGDAGATGAEAGAAGEGPTGPVKFPPATTFVTAAATSLSSPNFQIIGNVGESIGGTADSRREKSTNYIFIPGVVAGTSQ
jgi:hypothetical protein